MSGTLEMLLEHIRDGRASAEEVARARELVRGDARLPDELREVGLTDAADLVGDAVGLLAVLGAAPLFGDDLRDAMSDLTNDMVPDEVDDGWEAIAEALRGGLAEAARDIDVANAVMMRLPPAWVYGPATAQAVVSEAGSVDVAADAMSELGEVDSLESLVAEAVRLEAGTVDMAAEVSAALGFDAAPDVAAAVRAEAGSVDVVAQVVATLALGTGPSIAEAVRSEGGEVEVAPGVTSALAFDELPVREAVRAEAGAVDLAAAVSSTLMFEPVPVAEAVRVEAGAVDVVVSVWAELGIDDAVAPVAEAVRAEAGEVDVSGAVWAELSLDEGVPVAESVRAEAGAVDVRDAVWQALFDVAPEEAPTVPVQPVLPAAVQAAPPVPQPVNRSVVLGAVLMAAVALLTFAGIAQYSGSGGEAPAPQAEIVFAAAGDVVVEDLDYADDVVVMQAEGDEGAVILWMEGA